MNRLKINIAQISYHLQIIASISLLNIFFLSSLAVAGPGGNTVEAYMARIKEDSATILDQTATRAESIKVSGSGDISKPNAGQQVASAKPQLPNVPIKPLNIAGYGTQTSALGGNAQPNNPNSIPVKVPSSPFQGMSWQQIQALILSIIGQFQQITGALGQQQGAANARINNGIQGATTTGGNASAGSRGAATANAGGSAINVTLPEAGELAASSALFPAGAVAAAQNNAIGPK